MTNQQVRSNRRGREARRQSRLRSSTAAYRSYTERKIPVLNVLDDATLDLIIESAERVLEEAGFVFGNDPKVHQLWKEAGAEIKGTRIHIPRGLALKLMKSAPGEFIQHARDPNKSTTFGGDRIVFGPGAGSPFISKIGGDRRYGTKTDFQDFVKLTQSTPYLQHNSILTCEPTDLPVNHRHLEMIYSLLKYNDKPFLGISNNSAYADDMFSMLDIAFGESFVKENAVVLANISINSPLVIDAEILQTLIKYANLNQAILVSPGILSGSTAPATPIGILTQIFAESLAVMSFTQLVKPGAPVMMGAFVGTTSMRTGAVALATPEASLITLAAGQLSRRLGVPYRSGGALSSSKVPDAQAGYESAQSMLVTLLAGVNFSFHSAGWLESGLTMNFEKFIMDLDEVARTQVFSRGIDTSDIEQAVSAIIEVGPGRHFLDCAHTLEHFETASYNSFTFDIESIEEWERNGSMTTEQRANKIWKTMLEEYENPPLEDRIDQALLDFMKETKEKQPGRSV